MALVTPVTIDGVTVDRSWITPIDTARVHLLPAKKADVCVVIRRGPSKLFHVMQWDTARDRIDHGSWFRGKLYPFRCDVSWDGRFMVYLAMGADGRTWNGVCEPPWLKTLGDCPNVGTWAGGGVFISQSTLSANTHWHSEESLATGKIAGLTIERLDSGGEDEPVLHRRLLRDGWHRRGPSFGTGQKLATFRNSYRVATVGDDGWEWTPTKRHPALRMWYRGYLERGRTFEFELEGSPLLDAEVEWATWSSVGDLLVARRGGIERYLLRDIGAGRPHFRFDVDALVPPEA